MKKLLLPFYCGRVTSELGADYILPDTYPDVKRILRVRARPIELGRFISGGRVEFTGAVDYIVTFSAEDESGKDRLCAVHFAADYQGSAMPDDPSRLTEGCEMILEPTITTCTASLLNPRKLSLRATVATDVRLAGMSDRSLTVEGSSSLEEEARLERLIGKYPTLLEKVFIASHEQLSENSEPDASQPAIESIITCDAEFSLREVKLRRVDGHLTAQIKGEALVDCIYRSENGDFRSFARKLPISLVVGADECSGLFEDALPETVAATAEGILTELNCSVGENSYGERRVLELDLNYDVKLHVLADAECELTLDAYSVERESECVGERLELSKLGGVISTNFSVSESVARETLPLPTDSEAQPIIISSRAEVELDQLALERGRLRLSGEASVSCIASHGGGFLPIECKLPVRCELNVGELSEPFSYCAHTEVSDLRVRLDPSRLCCDFEVSLGLILTERRLVETVSTLKLAPGKLEHTSTPSKILFCYPKPTETLWKLAKRYTVPIASLKKANPELAHESILPTSTSIPHVVVVP